LTGIAADVSPAAGPAGPTNAGARVVAVHAGRTHTFSKAARLSVTLLAGLGVAGDAHCGATVRHRSRLARQAGQPNRRQVHLIHEELLRELAGRGFRVRPGELGENVTTQALGLLQLPAGTRLQLGETAVVELTGLRNPCVQIDRFQPGLMSAVLDRDERGRPVRKSGVMAVVTVGGVVYQGDPIQVVLPDLPYRPLAPV
jgi:MOSC domain-containing protein YiiM